MKEENITFSGKEASIVNLDSIVNAIASIPKMEEPRIEQISHNCSDTEFLELFDIKEKTESSIAPWFGLPVYSKKYIPLGEVWLQDKEGKVIKKYKV
jgi:hypothetical protein